MARQSIERDDEPESGYVDYTLLNRRREQGKFYTIVVQKIVGAVESVPVLWVWGPDNPPSVVWPLVEYTVRHSRQSITTLMYLARSGGLLMDYGRQTGPAVTKYIRENPEKDLNVILLQNFASALEKGTIEFEGLKAVDPSDLWWPPRGAIEAKRLLSGLVKFIDWLGDMEFGNQWANAILPAELGNDPLNVIRAAHHVRFKKNVNLLSHIEGKELLPAHRRISDNISVVQDGSGPLLSFPPEYVWEMMTEGFRTGRDGENLDVCTMCMALIIFLGGLRGCELFHIFVNDLTFVNGLPVIFLHHPVESTVTWEGRRLKRWQYLQQRYSRAPRNLIRGPEHSGWKGIAGDMHNAQVHWLPIDGVKEFVGAYLAYYLTVIRPEIMKRRRLLGLPDHPYLFVSEGKVWANSRSRVGDPYTISAFRSAWSRAVKRLRRKYDTPLLMYGKDYGTTPHGGRHFYAHSISELAGDSDLIMRCLHHLSPFSQLAYTVPSPAETNRKLEQSRGRTTKQPRSLFQALEAQLRKRTKGGRHA